MPFAYSDPAPNPYALSIADVLLRRGDIAAQGAQQIANAEGHAAEVGGNAWAGAVRGIAGIPQEIQQQQAAQQTAAIRQQELQAGALKLQQAQAGQKVGALIAKHTATTADGHLQYDVAGFLDEAKQDPSLAAFAHEPADAMTKANDGYRQFLEGRTEKTATALSTVLAHGAEAGGTPDDLMVIAAPFIKGNVLSPDDVLPWATRLAAVPDQNARVRILNAAAGVKPQYQKLAAGESLVDTSAGTTPTTVMSMPDKPVVVAPGSSLVQPTTGAVVATTPDRMKFEAKPMLLDGKQTPLNFNPDTGQYSLPGTQTPIDPARIRPIPAASIQIQNQRDAVAGSLPAWALDDSRPTGPDGNKMDPSVRMTPNGLYQAAQTYIATGQFPPVARGSDPGAQAVRTAVISKVGAIAASAGMDEPTLRAFYKANTQSLAQQQKLYDSAQSNISTADKNVAELEPYLAKLPDTGSPLFNKPLRAFAQSVKGDPNMGPIATYLASVQNEYGKIISSANGASAVLTDSARHEAQQLLDPNATVAQMLGSIKALKTEGGNRLLSIGEQIQRIQQRMQNPGATNTPLPGQPIKVGGFTVTVNP